MCTSLMSLNYKHQSLLVFEKIEFFDFSSLKLMDRLYNCKQSNKKEGGKGIFVLIHKILEFHFTPYKHILYFPVLSMCSQIRKKKPKLLQMFI